MIQRRITDVFFLASLFSISFIALRWPVAGVEPKLADFFVVGFLGAYIAEVTVTGRRPRKPVLVVLCCAAVVTVAYVAGIPAIEDRTGLVQFCKALGYFVLHVAFLAAGVERLASRSPRFFRLAFGCLLAGIAANGAYAALQLVAAKMGHNLDAAVLSPVTGARARSVMYGMMYGPDAMRARGFTRDPNHLGVMLLIPALALLALSAKLPAPRRRPATAAGLSALLLVLALTLSRSAAVGLAAGLLFLIVFERRRIRLRAILVPLGAAAVGLALIAAADVETSEGVAASRLGLHGFAGAQHFRTYLLIRPALAHHLFFGVGLNNFPLTYAQRVDGVLEASGSFYVQSLVEAGVVGTAAIALFLVYILHRLFALNPHPAAAVLGAPLIGTLAANAFYMTLTFSYFAAFLIFVIVAMTCPRLSGQALGASSLGARAGGRRSSASFPRPPPPLARWCGERPFAQR